MIGTLKLSVIVKNMTKQYVKDSTIVTTLPITSTRIYLQIALNLKIYVCRMYLHVETQQDLMMNTHVFSVLKIRWVDRGSITNPLPRKVNICVLSVGKNVVLVVPTPA